MVRLLVSIRLKKKNRNLKVRALPLGTESCLPNKKQTNPADYFYCVYKEYFSIISPAHYCKAASFFSSEVQIRGERQNPTSLLKDNILLKQEAKLLSSPSNCSSEGKDLQNSAVSLWKIPIHTCTQQCFKTRKWPPMISVHLNTLCPCITDLSDNYMTPLCKYSPVKLSHELTEPLSVLLVNYFSFGYAARK